MQFLLLFFSVTLSRCLLEPVDSGVPANGSERVWLEDYEVARQAAIEQRRQLLIYFTGDLTDKMARSFEQTLVDPEVQQQLSQQYVLVRVKSSACIDLEGKSVRILDQESFQAMNGRAGLAIVDYLHVDAPYYGQTVGCLPFEDPVYYAPPYQSKRSVLAFLSLPPGTITQRMMIYALRVHPEAPESTSGVAHPVLMQACCEHSRNQANRGLQGHHGWERRFQEIWKQTKGKPPIEVCAESWPGKTLLAACLDCVHSWRQSAGHWNAVHSDQPAYGFDICRGKNGIWYATGILGAKAN